MRLERISDDLLRLRFDLDVTPAQTGQLCNMMNALKDYVDPAERIHREHPDYEESEIYRMLKVNTQRVNMASVRNMIRYQIINGHDSSGLTFRNVFMDEDGLHVQQSNLTKGPFRIIGDLDWMFDRARWCHIVRNGEGSSTLWGAIVILNDDQITSMNGEEIPSEITRGGDYHAEDSSRRSVQKNTDRKSAERSLQSPVFTEPESYIQYGHSISRDPSETSRRIRLVVPNDCDATFVIDGITIEVSTYQAS